MVKLLRQRDWANSGVSKSQKNLTFSFNVHFKTFFFFFFFQSLFSFAETTLKRRPLSLGCPPSSVRGVNLPSERPTAAAHIIASKVAVCCLTEQRMSLVVPVGSNLSCQADLRWQTRGLLSYRGRRVLWQTPQLHGHPVYLHLLFKGTHVRGCRGSWETARGLLSRSDAWRWRISLVELWRQSGTSEAEVLCFHSVYQWRKAQCNYLCRTRHVISLSSQSVNQTHLVKPVAQVLEKGKCVEIPIKDLAGFNPLFHPVVFCSTSWKQGPFSFFCCFRGNYAKLRHFHITHHCGGSAGQKCPSRK